MSDYDARDHYWFVGGDEARAWSSARAAYVDVTDKTFAAWRESGRPPTRIASEEELWDVLAKQAPERLPALPAADDRRRETALGAIDVAMLRILLNQENRIRALEGKAAINAAQFRAALRGMV